MLSPDRSRGNELIVESGESRLRLQTSVRLRWFAVVGQVIAVLLTYFAFGFGFEIGLAILCIAVSAWLNVVLRFVYPARHRLSTWIATSLLLYDTIQLAALLYLTGGIVNPFVFLIVAPVTVSAATLPPRITWVLGVFTLILAAVLVDHYEPLPWIPGPALEFPRLYRLGQFAAIFVSLVFLALYAGRLSKEARQMSEALAATDLVLAHEQKLHALDGLAAAAAHELGTPLGTVLLVTREMLKELPPGSPMRDDIELLNTQAERCRDILKQLTRQPSEQDPLHAHLTLGQLLDEAAAPYRHQAITVAIEIGPDPAAGPDPGVEPLGERRPGVIHALGNFIENGVDFAHRRVDVLARWSQQEVVVTISDDGPGFPPEVLETLGEPYITARSLAAAAEMRAAAGRPTRAKTTGLGLGVFIARTLIERSGGRVTFANRRPSRLALRGAQRGGVDGGALVRIVWRRADFAGHEPPAAMSAWPKSHRPSPDGTQPTA